MPNLTENVKVLILSKLEEGCSIQMLAHREEHRAEDKTDYIIHYFINQ
jgi:hypothetical protein